MPAAPDVRSVIAPPGQSLTEAQAQQLIAETCPTGSFPGQKILLIVPDMTRTAPVGLVFKTLFAQVGAESSAFDVIFALGTHPPMPLEAMLQRLEISHGEKMSRYRKVNLINHAWNTPSALHQLGVIPSDEINELSGGLFAMDVPVQINRAALDYDQLIIIGPVFPHEVVGFSGGNKYLFPGISGPEILNFFHWLGAVVTNAKIIGNKWTPVRRVVDRAAALVTVPKLAFCLVVEGPQFCGIFSGSPEAAWDQASELSRQIHITVKPKPFHTILSCAPPMYDELWVGGKCMYKLEPVLADGGELIIYAPHIPRVSEVHGKLIEAIGYHCRDYFVKQWDKFKDYPWGTLAHSTHVYGQGTYDNGVETPRARVTLATGIDEATCRKINLGFRDPTTINKEDFADREDEGILLVPKAGERLFQLEHPPEWARLLPTT
jgi:nickel-dependent lactate racemase